jgi:hypothetical protein
MRPVKTSKARACDALTVMVFLTGAGLISMVTAPV